MTPRPRTLSTGYCWLSLSIALMGFSGCGSLSSERVLYEQQGIRIGIEEDPSVARSGGFAHNDHPATFTSEEIHALLGVIEVSGWSGTLVGILEAPRPVPLFQVEELQTIAPQLVTALHEAGKSDRVFFSLPHRGESYSEDRTSGAIFARGRYLHVVVTDHVSIIRADTGGGDPRDIRDTKGMKLWVARPAEAATVPDAEEPRWAPFETVHISLNAKDLLARRAVPSSAKMYEGGSPRPLTVPSQPQPAPTRQSGSTPEDLQLQIRELTSSNLELRERLEEQKAQMKALTEEMNRLRREIENTKAGKPSLRKPPSP